MLSVPGCDAFSTDTYHPNNNCRSIRVYKIQAMKDSTPKTINLKDYTQPYYWIDTVDLVFELGEENTRVVSTLALRKNSGFPGDYPLVLSGEQVQLGVVKLDGVELAATDYMVSEEELTIHIVPDRFELEVETIIRPQDNTTLEGL